ncbi:hypothetical protein BH11PSE7_BH11PSE7_24720 [soil metagenome]
MSITTIQARLKRVSFKAPVAAMVLLAAAASHAQEHWLTVSGDPQDTTVNTIQVHPIPLQVGYESRTMRVRVSRSLPRTSWDGIAYRSYESRVQFDCAANTARYLTITYFAQPMWAGESYKTSDYTTGTPRMMEFRDVSLNPNVRIKRAACASVNRSRSGS